MLKPYLIIKYYQAVYSHRVFETMQEAFETTNSANSFPGDFICSYNLSTEKYIQVADFPGGINNAINDIIQQQILNYKNAFNMRK